MLGTIVNTIAIIFGTLFGILIKGGLKVKYQVIVKQAVGLAVLFLGASSAIGKMTLPEANPLLFIISLIIGGIVGTLLDIEGKLAKLGDCLQSKFGGGKSTISKAFVTSSLLFCVGTMAILGSLESGIQGVHNTLFAKSVLDGVMSVVLASSLGIGVILSAVTVFVYQGTITLLAAYIGPFLTNDMIREISIVGGILITGLGLDVLEIKTVSVGNLLPAILVPVIYYAIV